MARFGPQGLPWEESAAPIARAPEGEWLVSPPVRSPFSAYPTFEDTGLPDHLFELPGRGLSAEQHEAAMAAMRAYHGGQHHRFLGFQANLDFDFTAALARYLDVQINNLGDPFGCGRFTLNAKAMERAVLDWYACLWNARWPHDPHDPESYWGYLLTMGSTEGNLYGLWNAREYLSGGALLEDPFAEEEARLASLDGRPRRVERRWVLARPRRQLKDREELRAMTPVLFCSQDTHYSLEKAGQALRIKSFTQLGNELYPGENPLAPGSPWPDGVPSLGEDQPQAGAIDLDALERLVGYFAAKGHPILVCFNYGTTFRGAYDDVEGAGQRLLPIFERHGLLERELRVGGKSEIRNGFWFHVDGALGAGYMPFVEMAQRAGRLAQSGPRFDFRLPFVHSLVVSGHKWLGAPWPCGVYMTRTKYQLRPPGEPVYVGTPDTTFAGSRSGLGAIGMWSALARTSYEQQTERILGCFEVADYAVAQLEALGERLGLDLWVRRTDLGLTVRFRAAAPAIEAKYSLASAPLSVNGESRDYSHIFAMPHVSRALIDELIADLGRPNAFKVQEDEAQRAPLPLEPRAELTDLWRTLEEAEALAGTAIARVATTTGGVRFRAPRFEVVAELARYGFEEEVVYERGQRHAYLVLEDPRSLTPEVLALLRERLADATAWATPASEVAVVRSAPTDDVRRFLAYAQAGRGFRG